MIRHKWTVTAIDYAPTGLEKPEGQRPDNKETMVAKKDGWVRQELSIAQCLHNYILDLEYQLTDLHECYNQGINFLTCGTPEFADTDEAWDYINELKETYRKHTGITYGDQS